MANETVNRPTYISDAMTDRMTVPTANTRFSTMPSSKKLNLDDCDKTTTDNRKWQYRRFARQSCNFWQSIVVAIIWLILCRARPHRKSRIWRWNLDAICQSSRDVVISGFGGHIDISVVGRYTHRLIPQIDRWNFNCTFHSFRDINISGFVPHFRLLVITGIVKVHFQRVCHCQML